MLLQLLITIGVSQALSLIVLLLFKGQKTQADFLLGIELFLLFIITILYNYKAELEPLAPGIGLNAIVLGYLALPVFYFYIKAASNSPLKAKNWTNWLHFVPFLAATILLYAHLHALPFEERCCMIDELHNPLTQNPWWFKMIYYGLFLVMFPLYLFLSFRALRQHETYILTKFSYVENISLGWLNRFLWGNIILWLAFLCFEVVGSHVLQIVPKEIGLIPGFLVMVALVLYLGIEGLQQRFFFTEEINEPGVEPEEDADKKYQSSGLAPDRAETYLRKLQLYMDTQKPYLEPKITIGELAELTEIPVNYLSQVINDRLGQNFFDFINSYRVREFQHLLQQPEAEQYTLLSLAHEAGFNSKSTFNAIFKKYTGQTPSEYARQLKPAL